MNNPTMTFVSYQPFDLDLILKVIGDERNFKIATLNRGTKGQ